jgi:hypothetical protein
MIVRDFPRKQHKSNLDTSFLSEKSILIIEFSINPLEGVRLAYFYDSVVLRNPMESRFSRGKKDASRRISDVSYVMANH